MSHELFQMEAGGRRHFEQQHSAAAKIAAALCFWYLKDYGDATPTSGVGYEACAIWAIQFANKGGHS